MLNIIKEMKEFFSKRKNWGEKNYGTYLKIMGQRVIVCWDDKIFNEKMKDANFRLKYIEKPIVQNWKTFLDQIDCEIKKQYEPEKFQKIKLSRIKLQLINLYSLKGVLTELRLEAKDPIDKEITFHISYPHREEQCDALSIKVEKL